MQAGCTGILGLSPGKASDGLIGALCDVQGGDMQTQCGVDSNSNPYVCAIGACRVSCSSDSDCANIPTGDGSMSAGRCIKSDGNGYVYGAGSSNGNGVTSGGGYNGQLYGCVPLAEATCSGSSCGPGKVCDSTGECRTSCSGGGFVGSQLGEGGCASDQACQDTGAGSFGCYGPSDPGFTGGASSGASSSGFGSSSGGPSSSGFGSSGIGSSSGSFDASVSSCTGTPSYTSCQQCVAQGCSCPGCTPTTGIGSCSGTPMIASCSQCGSAFGCSTTYCPGCVNDPFMGCSGALQPCSSNSSAAACMSETGCTWTQPAGKGCSGALLSCQSLSTTMCTTQPGCFVSGGGSSGGSGSGSSDGSTCQSGSCNCLALTGPAVSVVASSGSAPPGTGGTVQPGTYVLTAATFYTSGGSIPPGFQIGRAQSTLQITATSLDEANVNSNGLSSTLHGSWSSSGATLYVLESCPTSGELIWSFSASSSMLTLDVPAGSDAGVSGTLVETFTLH
jgi:hypothetical protein